MDPDQGPADEVATPTPIVEADRSLLRVLAGRVRDNLRDPWVVLPLVLIAALVARALWIDLPAGKLIFDETYYVNAARVLLGWAVPVGGHYAGSPAGLDPNMEHPPLGKLFMALSMAVFGDNGLGWRLPSVIAGMVALGALFRIVRAAGESAWLGVLAVALFAFDNLAFVHGRIGTLDMPVLAAILVGAWLALTGRWLAAGAVTGIGFLIKLTALYGLLAILLLAAAGATARLLKDRRIGWGDLRPGLGVGVGFGAVALIGLWLLDARFTTYANPIDHIRHMLQYGADLRFSAGLPTTCTGVESTPWQWLVNECQINYLRVTETVRSGSEVVAVHPTIDFRGALNPVLAGALPLAFLATAWSAWRDGSRLARWALVWAGANYLPYVALALLDQRITYLYYFLPVVPAVAVAIAILLRRSGLPGPLTWGFLAAYAFGFAAFFPFRQIP